MSSQKRKSAPPKSHRPRFPVESLPPEVASAVRAVARSERTTETQAALAALIAMADSLADSRAAVEMPDGTTVALFGEPIDFDFLVPDRADRSGVRRAYAALVAAMPEDGQRAAARCQAVRETAAGTMAAISRAEAIRMIADHYETRDAYLIAVGAVELPDALSRVAGIRTFTAYLDCGEPDLITTAAAEAIKAMPGLAFLEPLPLTAVIAIPKTMPAGTVGRCLGTTEIPPDGSRDMILLRTGEDGRQLAWPLILVEAIAKSDPETAATIRRGERDMLVSQMPPAVGALVDQADAAGAHGARILQAIADSTGATVTFRGVPPLVYRIAEGMTTQALTAGLGLCPHLSATAPEPAFWTPWAPDLIRCGHCNADVGRALHGSEEDQTCDSCRRRSDEIFIGVAQTQPIVANLAGVTAAFGPIMISYGLCRPCHETALEQAGLR